MAKRNPRLSTRVREIVEPHLSELVQAIAAVVRRATAMEIAETMAATGDPLRPRKRRILPCIAPGCTNISKGPRFHYLCSEHRRAPKKDWETWQKAQREKLASERSS